MRRARVATALVLFALSTAGAATPEGTSFLWRARSGEREVYLLGSIHFMRPDVYPLSPAIEGAFERSGVVAFETDLDALNGAAVGLLAAGTLDDGVTLDQVVPHELYVEVEGRLQALGMDSGGFATMKPWMVALSLTSFELIRAGYLGDQGIDATLNRRAAAEGKQRLALESVEFQVSLFADLTADESEDFLRYTLAELDSVIPLVDDIVDTWRAGDPKRLEALLAEGFKQHRGLFKRLVTERNLRWLPQVEALLRGDADAMVVVGSLHLVGEHGLVELLRGAGYEVEQL